MTKGKYIRTKEYRKKMSLANKGKKRSEELKRKMSETRRGVKNHFYGKHHSEESKKKMSLSKVGKKNIKLSETRRRLFREGKLINSFLGKKHSLKTKNKISLANKGNSSWCKGLKKETDERLNYIRPGSWKKGHISLKKNKTYNEFYGKEKSNKIKKLIKEKRKKQILPVKDTKIEVKVQNFLKKANIKFNKHKYMNIPHGYQADIFISKQKGVKKKTVIEAYGTYWHNYPFGRKIDIQRCGELRDKKIKTLVFWENEIKPMKLEDLKNKIIC